jgi:UDP-N-acetylmuramoyl-tripeptide--D-alanyl-D-alanine ligase
MTCQASLAQLIDVLAATPVHLANPDLMACGIVTDTRALQPGEVFLALRGETFDGHAFLETAAAKGAIAAIVDARYANDVRDANDAHEDAAAQSSADPPLPLIVVLDTLAAYQAIARWWRSQFTIPVVAITGSVGKTTTKELIAAVLATQGTVLKSQANFNNEIGVPKTLLELGPEHDFAVIEMGMRGRGQIALLSQIAQPDVAVITNVGTAHIGLLGSETAIAEAKCELLAEMPSTSTAILNHDNPLLLATAAHCWSGQTLTYGLQGGDLAGQMLTPETLQVAGLTLPLPLAGQHNALNYLAAVAVAKALHLPWTVLADRLTAGLTVDLPGGRAKRIALANDVLLLDETYNAGLESMLASLELLAQTPATRRIAVLGTMKELGDRSPEFHRRVGAKVRELDLDGLLILADPAEAAAMVEGAAPLAAEQFADHGAVVARLKTLVQPGDRLLFKASRAVGLDQVVTQLQAGSV